MQGEISNIRKNGSLTTENQDMHQIGGKKIIILSV